MMSRLLTTPNRSGGTTDHSDEIRDLRAFSRQSRGPSDAAIIARAAADLLEVHDASGISLDDWTGPRDLVNLALSRYLTRGTFTPNGV